MENNVTGGGILATPFLRDQKKKKGRDCSRPLTFIGW
jgi:hypothetical protein